MATETIKVKNLSKFGVQLESGEYVNWEKTIKDAEKGSVVPGGEYVVEMRRAESGKGYIVGVSAGVISAPKIVAPVFKDTPTIESVPSVAAMPMPKVKAQVEVKTDWAAKDRSQLIGGLSHDAAELAAAAVAYNVPVSSLINQYKLALEALIKIREDVK